MKEVKYLKGYINCIYGGIVMSVVMVCLSVFLMSYLELTVLQIVGIGISSFSISTILFAVGLALEL